MNAHQPLTNRDRVARRREVLRAQGLQTRQFWLPDFRLPAVREEAERQSRVVGEGISDDLAFAMAIQYWPPED
jgi:hypothetical protein